MGSVIRAVLVYLFLLVVFRIAGKRTLSDVTTFDFVLILIISESIQQALVVDDTSFTNAVLLVVTLISLNILISALQRRWPGMIRVTEGLPVLVVSNGKPLTEVMKRERIGEEDILHAARTSQGVKSLAEIEFAILETSGGISIIPRAGA
jgi:uncharacterized membrane protein YcaP (DUF421 family)